MVEEKSNLSGELEIKHFVGGTPETGTLTNHVKIFRADAIGIGSLEEVQPIT